MAEITRRSYGVKKEETHRRKFRIEKQIPKGQAEKIGASKA